MYILQALTPSAEFYHVVTAIDVFSCMRVGSRKTSHRHCVQTLLLTDKYHQIQRFSLPVPGYGWSSVSTRSTGKAHHNKTCSNYWKQIFIRWIWIWYIEHNINQQQNSASSMVASSSRKEQHFQQQYSSTSQMMSSSKRSAKISNASTVSNASSNLTVPNALSGLSDDEGTYQALSVVFEDSTDPRKKSKG